MSVRVGGPLGDRRIERISSGWYLIASHGDMVVRVNDAVPVGETASGELSFFDPAAAHLELEVADDGGILLKAANDHQLELAGGARSRRERLGRDRRVEVHLPHNVLQLDTDFARPALGEDAVQIHAVIDPQANTISRLPVARAKWRPEPRAERPVSAAVQPLRPNLGQRLAAWVDNSRPLLAAALIAVIGIGFALIYPGLRDDSEGVGAPPVIVPSVATAEAQASPALPVVLSPITAPPIWPTVERGRPAPQLAPAIAQIRVPQPPPAPAPTGPSARDIAGLEALSKELSVRTRAVAVRGDLRAARLALARGQLMFPASGSAYTLFSRAQSADPSSAAAESGLQAVREGLINRALAALAGGALTDARRSLEAATTAGADPALVANLQSEVDYRQQLTGGPPE